MRGRVYFYSAVDKVPIPKEAYYRLAYIYRKLMDIIIITAATKKGYEGVEKRGVERGACKNIK